MKIGFIGLGKLGLPCALAIESRGHEVYGFDIDSKVGNYLSDKKVPYKEEDIEFYLDKTKIQIISIEDMVGNCDIIFVAVQTPHNEKYEGTTRLPEARIGFDYSWLQNAIVNIVQIASEKNADQIVTIISTVLPGTIDELIRPVIQAGGNRIKLVYNPFFIAMGTTITDFLHPEFVLLGVDDPDARNVVSNFYKLSLPWEGKLPRIFNCSIRSAEAIKVLYNTYITQKICFINAAMELCYRTGADVDDISDALTMGSKRIISPMYMRGGMGDGGGCHPRDNIALSATSRKYGISYDWWENLMLAREKQTDFLAEIIIEKYRDTNYPIVILGKAFKPETNLTIGSPSILLYNILKEVVPDSYLHIYDPHVDGRVEGEGDIYIFQFPGPSIIFIGTKHELFSSTVFPAGSIVIDPWRYIPNQEGVEVIRIGEAKK